MQRLILWLLCFWIHSGPGLVFADPFEEAAALLGGVEGIQLSENSEGQAVLSGEVARGSDLKRIQVFLRRYPEVLNKTDLSPEAGDQIERQLSKRLKLIAPEGRLSRQGDRFILHGTDSQNVIQSLRKIYPSISFASAPNISRIQPTVFLEVALIEIKKTALRKLGTRLSGAFAATANLGVQIFKGQTTGSTVALDPIRGFLDMAMQNGEARVHAKQSVVTQNGKMGQFQVGGEFPIKVVNGFVAKVEFKDFGLILKFTPHLQGPKVVHLEIDSEVSDIDTGSMVDGIPVIFKKKLQTQVFANLDEMMAVGGIVQSNQSRFVDQLPGLSAIPILGRLFESEDFKRHNSEAYVFVTPRRMDQPWLPSPEL